MFKQLVLAGLLTIPLLMAADAPTPPPGWREHIAKDKSFGVWLPEKGRRSERERTSNVRRLRIKISLVEVTASGGVTYEASTLTLNNAKMMNSIRHKERLELIRDIFVSEVRGKVSSEMDVKSGESNGKEYTIEAGKNMARLRAFARGGRLYRAAVTGSKAQVSSKDADTFLDSFKMATQVQAGAANASSDKDEGKKGASGKDKK
jgi:hypothetical protein